MNAAPPSPYENADLYDLVLGSFDLDLEFWLAEARAAEGPVLEVACGTGRVLLHLAAHGIDVDGVDLFEPMLARLRLNAAVKGLPAHVLQSDMRDFTMPRRYRRVFIPFNGFAHLDTIDDQLRTLRCCREHLEPGGALVIHMSYPGGGYWLEGDAKRVLEVEVPHPESGHPVRMYDTRTKDVVNQRQDSLIDIEEMDGEGGVARRHRLATSQRWVYRHELELLLRAVGFQRIEFLGGFDRKPLDSDADQMMAFAWKD